MPDRISAQERLTRGYATSSPAKKPRPKSAGWPGGAGEESPEMERIRAGLSPLQRTSVGFARLQRGEQ
jgi:hypothetical protein